MNLETLPTVAIVGGLHLWAASMIAVLWAVGRRRKRTAVVSAPDRVPAVAATDGDRFEILLREAEEEERRMASTPEADDRAASAGEDASPAAQLRRDIERARRRRGGVTPAATARSQPGTGPFEKSLVLAPDDLEASVRRIARRVEDAADAVPETPDVASHPAARSFLTQLPDPDGASRWVVLRGIPVQQASVRERPDVAGGGKNVPPRPETARSVGAPRGGTEVDASRTSDRDARRPAARVRR